MPYLGHMTINAADGIVPDFDLGDRLRKARELLGMTRDAFADHTGISRGTVGNYELGKTKPNRLYLRTWARETGVSLQWLETGNAPTDDGGGGPAVRARRDSNSQPSDSVFALVRAA